MPNPWEIDWSQPQAPKAPGQSRAGGFIPPDPILAQRAAEEEERRRRDQALQEEANARAAQAAALQAQQAQAALASQPLINEGRQLENEAKRLQLAKSTAPAAGADPVGKLRQVIDQIDKVGFDSADNAGWFETGTTGSMMRGIPGTPAYDLAANIKTIDANMAFEALAEMRRNSPTGGALGSITEKELDLLRSTVSNLDPGLSQPEFFGNLATAKKSYLDMLRRIDPAAADEYNKRRGIRWDETGQPFLVFKDGEDNREPIDPMGVNASQNPPPGGGGGFFGVNSLGELGQGMAQGAGSMVEGAGNVLGALGGNLLGDTLYDALGYDQRYSMGEALRSAVGLPNNPNQTTDAIIQGGTAAMTGALGARSLASILAPGVARNSLGTIGAAPLTDAFAGMAAGGGADLARQSGAGPLGQTAAAIAAGLPIAAGGALASAARNRVPTPLAQAAERQNVDFMAADTGSPMAGRLTGGLSQSFVSAAPIRNAAVRNQDQIAGRANDIARGESAMATTDIAGANVQAAARRYSQQTSGRGGQLYQRAEQMAQGVRIVPQNALRTIDTQIARLSELEGTNGPIIRQLQTLRDDVANGVSVGSLRDLRTALRDRTNADGSLRSDAQQFMFGEIVDRISDDIDGGLTQAGRGGAAQAFRRADTYWRERVQHIDQVLQPIIGKDGIKGGEQVIQTLESMARGANGGNARLSRLIGNMQPDERAVVRATVIDRLGRATPGQQTADGTAFSASTFLTNWNRMTPQAKATLFREGDLRRNLDDIATLAAGSREAQRYANTSNTGGAATVGAYSVGAIANWKMAAVAAALQYGTARLLASPGFARLLARAPATTSPSAISQRIGVLATREPLIANDLAVFQQHFMNSVSQSPGRLAAREEENN